MAVLEVRAVVPEAVEEEEPSEASEADRRARRRRLAVAVACGFRRVAVVAAADVHRCWRVGTAWSRDLRRAEAGVVVALRTFAAAEVAAGRMAPPVAAEAGLQAVADRAVRQVRALRPKRAAPRCCCSRAAARTASSRR